MSTGPKGFREVDPAYGNAVAYVYRKFKIPAMGINTTIYLDGKEVGTLPNGSYLAMQVSPGSHKFSAKFSLINKMYYHDADMYLTFAEGEQKALEFEFIMTDLSLDKTSDSSWTDGFSQELIELARVEMNQLRRNN